MARAWLYGNDDSRPIRVAVDDLHPSSRIRCTLLGDDVPVLHCGVSRDMIRSLIASQRHSKLFCIGTVAQDELCAELDRDCVTVARSGAFYAAETETRRFCEQVASALAGWPLMWRCMAGTLQGYHSEYDVGPMHCCVGFYTKHVAEPLVDSRMLLVCCARFAAQFLVVEEPIPEMHELSTVQSFFDMLVAEGPLWHVPFDMRNPAPVAVAWAALITRREQEREHGQVALQPAADTSDGWYHAFACRVREQHDAMPDLHCVFGSNRELHILDQSLRAGGMCIREHEQPCRALPFPAVAYWKHGSVRTFMLEVL